MAGSNTLNLMAGNEKAIGSILIDIAARTAKLENDLRRVNSSLKGFKSVALAGFGVVNMAGTKLLGTVAALAGTIGMIRLVTNSVKLSNSFGIMAERLGFTTERIQALHHRAGELGVSFQKVDMAIARMNQTLGGGGENVGKFKLAILNLGLNLRELQQLKPQAAFDQIIDRLSRITNETQRAAIASEIFGRDVNQVLSLFARGSAPLKDMEAQLKKVGLSFSQLDLAKIRIFNLELVRVKNLIGDVVTVIVVQMAPILRTLLKNLTDQGVGLKNWRDVALDVSEKITTGLAYIADGFHIIAIAAKGVQLVFDGVMAAALGLVSMMGNLVQTMAEFASGEDLHFMEGFDEYALDAVDRVTETWDELRTKIGEPMPHESVKEWFNELRIQSEKAAKDIAQDAETIMDPLEVSASASLQRISQLWNQTWDGAADKLAEFITTGESDWKDFTRNILKDWLALYLKLQIFDPIRETIFTKVLGVGGGTGIGAGIGKVFGSIFGGMKAGGGDVEANKSYWTGENGPELFTPKRAGEITPSGGGSSGRGATFVIDARGADRAGIMRLESMVRELHGSFEERAVSAVLRSQARGRGR